MSQPTKREPEESGRERDGPTAAERLLRSLADRGISHVFANFGTDHTPLLEAAARVREAGEGDAIPEFVICPTEFPALSAAHGYAAATGEPQAVFVHVDVGTQNLGAAMHNAHRAKVPVFVVAGLAPVTHDGYPGSRDIGVHYIQDVFDQPGVVREYCRWISEYRPPTDPAELVDRGIARATAPEPGPVYLSATREALETPVREKPRFRSQSSVRATGADADTVDAIVERLVAAEAPLVITSEIGAAPGAAEGVEALVSFAEAVGAGVVEQRPYVLNFPRDHPLHAGFDPGAASEHADLVLLAATDVPWIPAQGGLAADVPVIQLDTDPTKRHFPQWPFEIDEAYAADPARTLAAIADRIDAGDSEVGRDHWMAVHAAWREAAEEDVGDAREAGRLTPAVLSDAINDIVDEDTLLVDDSVTSGGSVLTHVRLDEPGSYVAKGGSGLGFATGGAVGAKLARPQKRVIATVGDGAYLFGHPTVCAWMGAAYDAPTLTIVYDNEGWYAVETSTRTQHPEGISVASGVPESRFGSGLDLSVPATAAGAFTRRVNELSELEGALAAGVAAVDGGTPAVVSVQVEREAT